MSGSLTDEQDPAAPSKNYASHVTPKQHWTVDIGSVLPRHKIRNSIKLNTELPLRLRLMLNLPGI